MASTSGSPSAPADTSSVLPWDMVGRMVALMLKIMIPIILGMTLVGIIVFDGALAVGAALVGMVIAFFLSIPMVLACFEDEVIHPKH